MLVPADCPASSQGLTIKISSLMQAIRRSFIRFPYLNMSSSDIYSHSPPLPSMPVPIPIPVLLSRDTRPLTSPQQQQVFLLDPRSTLFVFVRPRFSASRRRYLDWASLFTILFHKFDELALSRPGYYEHTVIGSRESHLTTTCRPPS